MAFSSAAFVFVFLPIVCLLHTVLRNPRIRNGILIAASLLFYSVGSVRHLFLLLAIAILNYIFGLLFCRVNRARKGLLAASVVLNLSALVIFKYLGFFGTTVNSIFGTSLPVIRLGLPIGISFFTFQAMSYSLDVYRDPRLVTRNFAHLLLYLSFFPQLVAGPIVKYQDIAAQIQQRELHMQDMAEGCRRFCFGLSKKLLLADILAPMVDAIFAEGAALDCRLALLAGVGYSLQIYFDFSGYSDMAIGMGRMFGFHFLENFRYPYAAYSVRDFWKRWHISLTSWFRQYVYIPLGGNRRGSTRTCLNVLLVFFLTGLWHGANWTFVLWGLWHGLWSVAERVTPLGKWSGKWYGRVGTLLIVMIGFVIFRADSLAQVWQMIAAMFTGFQMTQDSTQLLHTVLTAKVLLAGAAGLVLCTGIQTRLWLHWEKAAAAQYMSYLGALLCLVLCMFRLASASFNPFIYFQF